VDQFYGKNVKLVVIGDWWDMSSLSSYDRGKREFEGRRVINDLVKGNDDFNTFNAPMERQYDLDVKNGKKPWMPDKYFTDGNHEDRLTRAISISPELEGLLSLDMMDVEKHGYNRSPYLKVVELDGISYSHVFVNPMTGKPYSGQNLSTRLQTIGKSFTMGHQQQLLLAQRYVMGKSQHGLVAGANYLHSEKYKGWQGNAHFRGIVVCHGVSDGSYDVMVVSLDFLCRKYEGVSLDRFMAKKYPKLWRP
jgi:hypothetical protein